MPKLLVIAALSLAPLTAAADDELSPPSATPPAATPTSHVDEPCAHHAWGTRHHRRARFAVGLAKGHMALDDDQHGRQVSLIARAQGRRGFGLELELSRTSLGDSDTTVRGGGVALYKAFGKRRLAPYVIVGAGGGNIEYGDSAEQRMRYAEAGVGLMLRGKRLAIGLDVRKGARKLGEVETAVAPPTMTSPAMVTPVDDERERYVRGRIMALVQF